MPSVCGGRSGWKSSQADVTSSVLRAVPSLERGGEGGVNTHTGSVRVAASQSNNVFKVTVEGESSANMHTGSVSVADSQSNIVCKARYVSPCMNISKISMDNDDISASCEVCLSGMCQPECLKSTDMNVKLPKSDIKNKETHAVAKPVPKSKVCSKPPSSSTLRL